MIRLNVPYKEKDEAKKYGARWNAAEKFWFYPGEDLPEGLMRWSIPTDLPENRKKDALSKQADALDWAEESKIRSAWQDGIGKWKKALSAWQDEDPKQPDPLDDWIRNEAALSGWQDEDPKQPDPSDDWIRNETALSAWQDETSHHPDPLDNVSVNEGVRSLQQAEDPNRFGTWDWSSDDTLSPNQTKDDTKAVSGLQSTHNPGFSSWLQDYQTVSEVNQMIQRCYGDIREFRSIMVWGEVTNYKKPSGGNYYFDIKDSGAMLPCIMWGSVAASMPGFTLKAGMKVAIIGYLDYYPVNGKTSLKVRQIRDAGEGEAALALLRLHAKLEAEGLFDERFKKPIPKYPSAVGIVTSKDGQAIRDICKTAADRNPYVQLFLYHVKVQGKHAPDTIVEGIRVLDGMGLDTIIVGRGGGSDEELMAYNDEKVVRAVFQARTPIISAIGHEGNWSLTDYAADYRESTPTKAAVKAIPDVMTDLRHIAQLQQAISSQMRNNLIRRRLLLDARVSRLESFHPRQRLLDNWERLQRCEADMQTRVRTILEERSRNLQMLTDELQRRISSACELRRHRCEVLITQLHGLSPTAKLIGGFGYITRDGKPVTSVDQIHEGDSILTRIHDGQFRSQVTEICEPTHNR